MTPTQLAEIEARVNGVEEAWCCYDETVWPHPYLNARGQHLVDYSGGFFSLDKALKSRVQFLGNAPQDMRALIAEVKRLRAALTDECDMMQCLSCGGWVYHDELMSESGNYDAHCDACHRKATHECVECGFRTSAPEGFDGVCPVGACDGSLVARAALGDAQ